MDNVHTTTPVYGMRLIIYTNIEKNDVVSHKLKIINVIKLYLYTCIY